MAKTPPQPAISEYRASIAMPHVTLRRLERADAERLAAIVTPGLFALDDIMADFDPVPWVERKLAEEMLPISHVVLRDGAVIGYVQVAAVKGLQYHYLAIGAWLARRHWGQGNSDEGMAAVQQVATAQRWPALYSRMHRLNHPAHRMVQRAGFQPWATPPDRPEPDFIWYRWIRP